MATRYVCYLCGAVVIDFCDGDAIEYCVCGPCQHERRAHDEQLLLQKLPSQVHVPDPNEGG